MLDLSAIDFEDIHRRILDDIKVNQANPNNFHYSLINRAITRHLLDSGFGYDTRDYGQVRNLMCELGLIKYNGLGLYTAIDPTPKKKKLIHALWLRATKS